MKNKFIESSMIIQSNLISHISNNSQLHIKPYNRLLNQTFKI